MDKGGVRQLILYSALHFCVDWACILLVTGVVRQGLTTRGEWLWCVLLYNAAAFALQLPLGALLDGLGGERRAVWLGCLLVAAGWLCPRVGLLPCVVAGVGNALFHLGGGGEILSHGGERAAPPGVFVSTGAVGVWLGVWCARQGFTAPWTAIGVMLIGAGAVLLLRRPASPVVSAPSPALDRRRLVAAGAFFLAVFLRSWLGDMMVFSWKTGWLSLAAVACVALGKAGGGLLGDVLGWSRCAAVTLTASALLFPFAFSSPAAGLLALFFFNTSMPLTLAGLVRTLGGSRRCLAFGLTTFAIFLGTLPSLLPGVGDILPLGGVLCGGAVCSALLILLGLRCSGGESQ